MHHFKAVSILTSCCIDITLVLQVCQNLVLKRLGGENHHFSKRTSIKHNLMTLESMIIGKVTNWQENMG